MMSHIKIDMERMWWSDKTPPLLLRAASRLYRLVNGCNLTLRQRRASTPPLPLISIGNLTAGGSGKTPFVIWLAGQLKQHGFRPVVICRGDGGKKGAPQLLNDASDPLIAGDEAVLLYRLCDCPVIAGCDRIRASRMAAEYGDIILLDDGFQYRQLERACDIVLIPAEGLGNGHLIPAGPLRESVQALARADLVVRTGHSDATVPLTPGKEWRWRSVENRLTQLAGQTAAVPGEATALTAIARPRRFIQSLEALDIEVRKSLIFPDHHAYSEAEVGQAASHGLPVIVTAKDAVKLEKLWPENCQLWRLEQSAEAEEGLFEAIQKQLKSLPNLQLN